VDWQQITPNTHGDWANQRNDEFHGWPAIGDRKPTPGYAPVFDAYSRGLATARDFWVYGFARTTVEASVRRMIDFYNSQVDAFTKYCTVNNIADPKSHVERFIEADPARISWGGTLKTDLPGGKAARVRAGFYRGWHIQTVQQEGCVQPSPQ
jgi:predicted helicase